MRWPRVLGLGYTVRRALQELTAVRLQLTRQNDLLERLANRFAPQDPITSPEEIRATTGVDYLDATEAGIVLDYIERTRQDLGREPEGDEILAYLADEKTTDLHRRLKDRAAELDRLTTSRRSAASHE
jgi:hypothetical protein